MRSKVGDATQIRNIKGGVEPLFICDHRDIRIDCESCPLGHPHHESQTIHKTLCGLHQVGCVQIERERPTKSKLLIY